MNVDQAISTACDHVGIATPKRVTTFWRWMKTDTLSGKSGKGDGRVIVNEHHVTAWNWQTGEQRTVALRDEYSPAQRKQIARQIERDKIEQKMRAQEAAAIASSMIGRATPAQHPYLISKGFQHERALVIDARSVVDLGGKYLLPDAGGERAILIPARRGSAVSSLQLIWEDGTKKFLANGEIEHATHRLSTGSFTWLCEGLATGLSLRTALKGLHRRDCVLCCFSAYNLRVVARSMKGRRAIVTDNDKPIPQYGGIGTGEWYARQTKLPFLMPPQLGDDLNDMHLREGIFAVQRLLSTFIREAVL